MGMPSFRLDGKVALVTGAGSGIGAGIAQGLAAFGAAVGCVDVAAAGLNATVQAITAAGGHAIALPADVRDEAQMEAAVASIEAAFGPLNAALNCAGVPLASGLAP